MVENPVGRVSQTDWSQFRENLRPAIETLFALRQKLSLSDNAFYIIESALGDTLGQIARLPIVSELRSSKAFRSLVTFVNALPALQIVFLKSSESELDIAGREHLRDSIQLAVELILLRIVARLEREASVGSETVEELIGSLIAFLDTRKVRRDVRVPIYHLSISSDEMVIERFGALRKIAPPSARELGALVNHYYSACSVELKFEVETDHFFAAEDFPISEEITKRVTLLRLFYQPLTSYNHFSVNSVQPWETPLHDSDFSSRFWAYQTGHTKIPSELINESPGSSLASALSQIESLAWNNSTPWRLAINRLDDAIFKLNSNSPDTILDLAIGLECIFTESESRQESVHKVAVRAARYLEKTEDRRRELFRQVKRIYRSRSTLAHGKAWSLDEEGMAQIQIAAKLLASTLRKMTVQGETELDLEKLDLG